MLQVFTTADISFPELSETPNGSENCGAGVGKNVTRWVDLGEQFGDWLPSQQLPEVGRDLYLCDS